MEKQIETFVFQKKLFFTLARNYKEYQIDIFPTEELLQVLRSKEVDVLTFIERRWCSSLSRTSVSWARCEDNVALLHIKSYADWLATIGKKTRNMIRKAEKNGIETVVTQPNDALAEGMWKIYNETPIRQERGFPHYGVTIETVKQDLRSLKDCINLGAYLQGELVGFVQFLSGPDTALLSQVLSLQRHRDKAINNILIAKTVEECQNQKMKWLIYGRMGNHPSLDVFKQNNGFSRFVFPRYYLPLTAKGRFATRLGLQENLQDIVPQPVKNTIIPFYNWVSRTKMKMRF